MSGTVTAVRPTTAPTTTAPTRRLADVAPQTAEQLRVAADAYIRDPLTMVQDQGIAAVHTTIQAMNAEEASRSGTGVGNPVTDYGNPLRSAMQQARSTAMSSAVRNGIAVARHKQDAAQAAGNVTADVVTMSARAALSQLATNGTVFALSRTGAGSFPILAGGMAAGYVASYATGKIMQRTGVRQTIAVKTTELVRNVGHHNHD